MKRKGFLIVLLLIAFGFFFAGCQDVEPTLSLSSTTFTTEVGQTATIVPVVGGVEGELEIEYSTSNASIATVSNSGTITAVAAGTATITVALKDYPDVKAEATVTVKAKPAVTISLSSVELTTVAGQTVTLTPFITGTTETAVVYTSSNTDVATVANGTVTTVAPGTAVITVALQSNAAVKAEYTVNVLKVTEIEDFAPTRITIQGQDEMYVGDTDNFGVAIVPSSANRGLFWSSSNPEVATVDNEGNVTALKGGTAVITAVSTIKATITNSFTVDVYERGSNQEIVLRAVDYLKARIPEYVNATFDLPVYPNDGLSVTWKKADGTAITDGKFEFVATADSTGAINLIVEYGDYLNESTITFKQVMNLDDNAFKTNDLVKNYLDVFFDKYTTTNNPIKVTESIQLPTSLKGATITWSSDKGTIISSAGVYVRPNDDTVVKLSATITNNGIGLPVSYNLLAKGYSAAEKVAYVLTEGTLAPMANIATNGSIALPTSEGKFNMTLAWSSDKPEVFDNTGKYANRDLDTDTEVTYTITFTYNGTALTETATIKVMALKATDTSKAAYDFLLDDDLMETVPTYFPYGLVGRDGVNTIQGLPTSMTDHDGVEISWAGNDDDFDGVTLKSQYLRHHEALLTATFTKDGVPTTTLEFVVNTGLAEDPDAMYIGGRFSEQKGTNPMEKYDLLNTFSYWDKMVGNPDYKGQQYWSYFSGYTFHINGKWQTVDNVTTFVQDEDEQRYQYFAMDFVTVYITAVDADGKPTYDYGNLREKTGGNWAILFVNLTDKEAKVPLATHNSGTDRNEAPYVAQGSREGAISFDGFRVGFTAAADGTVVLGNGKAVFQNIMLASDRTVPIPANGYGMTFKTQENIPDAVGVFANPGTKLTIQRFDLAPENDYRHIYYKSNLKVVEDALTKLEAGEESTSDIETALANAKFYRNNARLTDNEEALFDDARFTAAVTRSATYWNAQIAKVKSEQAEDNYLANLKALNTKYLKVISEVSALITDKAWFEAECAVKLAKYDITLNLNGGQLYTATRTEVVDLFVADLYAHLQAKGYTPLPADAAALKVELTKAESILNDAFLSEWIFEFYKDNANHLTVDNTAKQFIRQEAYNAKWKPLLYWLNDAIQIGHNGGRDFLGRVGQKYLWTYLTPSNYADDVVFVATANSARLREYINGNFAYGTYKELFLENTWTISVEASQAKVDTNKIKFTGADETVTLPTVKKPGNVFAGWYLDADLTEKATLTGKALGFNNVTIYAKWFEVDQLYTYKFFDGETELVDLAGEYCELEAVTLPNYSKDGFVFQGWYDNAEFTGDPVTEIELGETENKVFYAKMWEIPYSNVEVTYDLNGGKLEVEDAIEYANNTHIVATRYASIDWSGAAIIIHTAGNVNWTVIGIKPTATEGLWEVVGKGSVASIDGATRYIMYHDTCTSTYKAAMQSVYTAVSAGWLVAIPNMPTAAITTTTIDMHFMTAADFTNDVIETRLYPGDIFTPVKEGFTFAGWCTDENLTDEPITSFPGIAKELNLTSVKYYAKWEAVE